MAYGITNVNIGGEIRTVCFNNHSLIYLGKQLGCDPAHIMDKAGVLGDENPLRLLTFVIYAGLMGYLESKAIYVHEVTIQNVAQWVADSDKEEFQSVWDAFSEAMAIPKATPEEVKAYEKKNKIAKRLSKK